MNSPKDSYFPSEAVLLVQTILSASRNGPMLHYTNVLLVYVFVCVCVHVSSGVCRGQKYHQQLLELELQVLWAMYQLRPLKEQQKLTASDPSLYPFRLRFKGNIKHNIEYREVTLTRELVDWDMILLYLIMLWFFWKVNGSLLSLTKPV